MDKLKNWIPILVDVLGIVLHIVLFSSLRDLFALREARGWFVIAGAYLLFCFGVNGLKKLEPAVEHSAANGLSQFDFSHSRPWLIGLGLTMALTVLFIQADINELIESTITLMANTGEVHEGEVTLYYSFGPGFMWTILALFYVLVLITKVESNTPEKSNRFVWVTSFGLLSINLLIVVFAAYFSSLMARFELTAGSLIAAGVGLAILFEILFVPPRLLHYFKQPQFMGLMSFTIFVVYVLIRLFV